MAAAHPEPVRGRRGVRVQPGRPRTAAGARSGGAGPRARARRARAGDARGDDDLMPTFDEAITTEARPEEIWKLLYDPSRFPEWFPGVGSIEDVDEGRYTMYPDGYPDFPMPQKLETRQAGRQAVISCLVSNMSFEWRLQPPRQRPPISGRREIPQGRGPRPRHPPDPALPPDEQLAP